MTLSEFISICKKSGQHFAAKDTFEMGAALAYYAVFSLAPLVLIAVAIAGAVYGQKAAEGQIARQIETSVGPTVAAAVQDTIQNVANSGGATTASIVGVVLLIFGASGVFVQLKSAINAIWDCQASTGGGVWGYIRTRLLSFAMVVGVGILLLASLACSTAVTAMSGYLVPAQTAVYQVLNQFVSFLFLTLLFALIFRYLPDCRVDWGDVWIGAAVTALLFVVGKYLIGLYLSRAGTSSAYGAAGSLVIILVWVYYASQILLFGAVLTRVITGGRRESAAGVGATGVPSA